MSWSYANYPDRFWKRLAPPSENGCREWSGARSTNGYGRAGKNDYAHRIAYTLAHGPIPDGMLVLHRCDNKPCCEPTHLYAGTKSQNAIDAVARGLHYSPFRKRERARHGLALGGPARPSGGLRW